MSCCSFTVMRHLYGCVRQSRIVLDKKRTDPDPQEQHICLLFLISLQVNAQSCTAAATAPASHSPSSARPLADALACHGMPWHGMPWHMACHDMPWHAMACHGDGRATDGRADGWHIT